jgi:hypothetical protein
MRAPSIGWLVVVALACTRAAPTADAPGVHAAPAGTELAAWAATNVSYAYSAVPAPTSGLTAIDVSDALNQSAAVGYAASAHADQVSAGALTSAEQYTDQQVGNEAQSRATAVGDEAQARASADSTEAQARADAVSGEALLREGADDAEVSARKLAVSGEASARVKGDSDTLASAKAYADSLVPSVQPSSLSPFGAAISVSTSCSLNNGVLSGFCNLDSPNAPDTTKHSALTNVAVVEIFGSDGAMVVDLCNSQTNSCFEAAVASGETFFQTFDPPIQVDSMSPLSSGANFFGYSVLGFPAGNGGAPAADQSPFGWGLSPTSCKENNGIFSGFCNGNSLDTTKQAGKMLNLTQIFLKSPDAMLVQFCNSSTGACLYIPLAPNVPVFRQFTRPVQIDQMTPIGGNTFDYSVMGYD